MKRGSDPTSAAPFVPSTRDLELVAQASLSCRGCNLYKVGTQTVFGEGPAHAPIMMIGEIPGDKEDLEGRPFVGPAGELLNRAIEEAGLVRNELYVTNAVKHFNFVLRGKRRLHQKPNAAQIEACRPGLEREIELVRPKIILCLGATAAQSILGARFRLTKNRVVFHPLDDVLVIATPHPSAILRMPDAELRKQAYADLVADLIAVRKQLFKPASTAEQHSPN